MLKFRKLNLEAFDKNKHYALVRKMSRDNQIKEFISHRFVNWVEGMPNGKDDFEVGRPYVIVRDNKYIGILGTLDMSHDDIIDFWCAIDKDERSKGYGDVILREITNYLVEEHEDVRLRIKKWNKTSMNRAVKNGFVLDKEESSKDKDEDIYYYFGKGRK